MSLSQASLDVIAAAQASYRKFLAQRGPPVSVSLAQYAVESAWGSKVSGTNNFFGIKANSAQIAAGQFTEKLTHEQLPSGEMTTITAKFANYASLQDAFDAHATLLTHPRYIDCQNAKTPEDYCRALQKDGYATAQNYATVLIATINDNQLKQYDLPASGNTNTAPLGPPASAAGGSGAGPDPAAGATKGKIVTDNPNTTQPVVPASPPAVPSTPTAAPPVRMDWGDLAEQALSLFEPAIVSAVNAGLQLGANTFPGGELIIAFGEKMIDQAVASAATSLEGIFKGQSLTISPHNALESMVLQKISDELPLTATFLESQLPAWISAAVAKIVPTVPALAQAAAAAAKPA